jgi:hypothetical protein
MWVRKMERRRFAKNFTHLFALIDSRQRWNPPSCADIPSFAVYCSASVQQKYL